MRNLSFRASPAPIHSLAPPINHPFPARVARLELVPASGPQIASPAVTLSQTGGA